MAPVDQANDHERDVYRSFSDLSLLIKSFRGAGLASGEASRCNQYLSKSIQAFENIKHIYQYRTPRTLRAYSKFCIWALPLLYGPYFVALAADYEPRWMMYVTPVLFSVILVCLDNIQDHLEDPFDQIGEDDVNINAEKFVEQLAEIDTVGGDQTPV